MQIGKVVKKVVSTVKNENFEGIPLLLVQPLNPDLKPTGTEVLCLDFMGSDINEIVLFMKEGSSVNDLLGKKNAPADAGIVAIVDDIIFKDVNVFQKNTRLAGG